MNDTYYIVQIGRYYLYEDFADPQMNLITNMDSATRYKEADARKTAEETGGSILKVTIEPYHV